LIRFLNLIESYSSKERTSNIYIYKIDFAHAFYLKCLGFWFYLDDIDVLMLDNVVGLFRMRHWENKPTLHSNRAGLVKAVPPFNYGNMMIIKRFFFFYG
jgi:hypothetical protein